ncbi:MAG TPA: UDP-N-acetylmuramoyl-L-alanyl-D-glutamate--2,6-diaminopimelate ligase [Syntrophales bacterium]|nr:UDP-N-acetylmuramoyl-L-alanyl-D-glutamate--2,6-diaminopimelate ligase [Syntrophales bacterium]
MQLAAVLQNIDVIMIQGSTWGQVNSICYDSRRCERGSLFVAIPGLKTDGHRFIPEALSRGASFIVHEKDFTAPAGVTAIRVGDSRRILGRLGRNFYRHPSTEICLLAVTGTNGKTTVTYLLEAIIKAAGFQPGILGTVNYRYSGAVLPAPNTTPESFDMHQILRQMADAGVSHVIAEVSSHAVDLRRIDDCDFDLGIFTNLSQDHLDYHGDMERYYAAKKRFFSEVLPQSRKGRPLRMIVNIDDPWGERLHREVVLPTLTFGIDRAADVRATTFTMTPRGTEARLQYQGMDSGFSSALIGQHNLYNILTAAAAALAIDIPEKDIVAGIAAVTHVPGRLEKVNRPGEPEVLVDYAHTDDALAKVLKNLSFFRKSRIITVFGCGGDRDRGKRPLMGRAAVRGSDITIMTSDNPRSEDPLAILGEIEAGVADEGVGKYSGEELLDRPPSRGYAVIPDRLTAIETAIAMARPEDIVLIAGKGHEDYQIVGSRRLFFDDRLAARAALDKCRQPDGRS